MRLTDQRKNVRSKALPCFASSVGGMTASTLAGSSMPSSAPKMACDDSKSRASVGIASLTGDRGREEAAEVEPEAKEEGERLDLAEARLRP